MTDNSAESIKNILSIGVQSVKSKEPPQQQQQQQQQQPHQQKEEAEEKEERKVGLKVLSEPEVSAYFPNCPS